MQEEPSAANDCGMLPNVDKDCTPCEGDTPYVDLVTQECVAECTVGHEINNGHGLHEPDKGQCVACHAGKFADHVKHTCGSACPEGTTENDDARNCDSAEAASAWAAQKEAATSAWAAQKEVAAVAWAAQKEAEAAAWEAQKEPAAAEAA